MNQRPRPIPLAAWIASRNPVLRARAETALYHFGPDAGDALFAAADSISRFVTIKRSVLLLPFAVLAQATVIWLAQVLTSAHLSIVLDVWVLLTVERTIHVVGNDVYWRRKRLKALGLALSRREDLRGIGPLLEAWRPVSAVGSQLRDDEIETELTRVLPLFLAQKSIDLRSYKKRILRKKVRRLFPARFASRRVEPRGDFSNTRADLIVTLIQLLSRSNSEADLALIERISRMNAIDTNAVFIRDAAIAYRLAAPNASNNVSAVPTNIAAPSTATQPIQVVAKRS